MLLGIIGWTIVGSIAGFLLSKVVNLKGDDPRLGIAVGVVGALLGGWLFSFLSGSIVTSFNLWSLFFAGVGACVCLIAWHIVRGCAAPIPYLNKRYR